MNFLSFINPSLGINLIKKEIKKQLNKEVENFDILFIAETEKIFFIIDNKKYPFPSDTLKSLIELQTKGKLEKGDKLNIVEIKIEGDKINSFLYMERQGKKIKISHSIN